MCVVIDALARDVTELPELLPETSSAADVGAPVTSQITMLMRPLMEPDHVQVMVPEMAAALGTWKKPDFRVPDPVL